MLADVTGRADDPLAHEPCVEDLAAFGMLLRERGVAGQAEARGLRIALPEILQLARHPRPHARPGMFRPPIGGLGGGTPAATPGGGRRPPGREVRGGGARWRDRPRPGAAEKTS